MGLDQYLYAVRKCTPDEIALVKGLSQPDPDDEPWLDEIRIIPLYGKDYEEAMYHDIQPFSDRVTLDVTEWDMAAFRAARNVPADWVETGSRISPGSISFTFSPPSKEDGFTDYDAEPVVVETDSEEMSSKFSNTIQRDHIVFTAQELHYWRNDYRIQDTLSDSKHIENCGWHLLSEDDLRAMMAIDANFRAPLAREDEKLFYHPWW